MKTISITVDDDLLQSMDRAARAAKTNRSELFRVALREWLAGRRRRKLAEEDRAGYERLPVTADEFSGLIASQPLTDEDWS
jgi:metal-responsive CopG/Arc/MetJ family transcriptional regulator